jgi:regulatory protein
MDKRDSKIYDLNEARRKLEYFCTYRDRCISEVEQKMNDYGLIPEVQDQLLLNLIQNKFLDEERFARSFVRGKFGIKKWGRNKIISALRYKKVSEPCVRLGLAEINEDKYQEVIRNLIIEKWKKYARFKTFQRKGKTAAYLMQRGFEAEEVWNEIRNLESENQLK